jgi:chromatin segregation and condensation protein Rec8/ScpA/Scc1 (kleisin family)
MREKIKIFKKVPELDAEIRTIQNPDDKDKEENYFIVDVGLYDSLGEQGEILTRSYDSKPTEEEIISDTRQDLKEDLENLSETIYLSAREEKYLAILNKLAENKQI